MIHPNPYIALTIMLSINIFGLLIYSKVGNNARKIKRFYNFIKSLNSYKQIFLFFSISLGFLIHITLFAFKINLFYIAIYIYFIIFTYILFMTIGEIIERDSASKWYSSFLILRYLAIVFAYIVIFAGLYVLTSSLKYGQFYLNDKLVILTLNKILFISGITLLSYDVGYTPTDYMQLFMFIQVFISQVVILGFLFAIVGELLRKYRETKLLKTIEKIIKKYIVKEKMVNFKK